jgi:hypothetical protein
MEVVTEQKGYSNQTKQLNPLIDKHACGLTREILKQLVKALRRKSD